MNTDIDLLARKLDDAGPVLVLSGAGCSTKSGLGDYRDVNGKWKRKPPITASTFLNEEPARKRYWARSSVGWPQFARAQPGDAHRALATLEAMGRTTMLVTQNVDGLHQKAGHRQVIDLHGTLSVVRCTKCQATIDREVFQQQLMSANPQLSSLTADYAPDGDADLEQDNFEWMDVPACDHCGGLLKPDVVFFGENVARNVVEACMQQLERSGALLVAGSSLMVYSGLRFCRRAEQLGLPIYIINLGVTRADELASLKIIGDVGDTLTRLTTRLPASL